MNMSMEWSLKHSGMDEAARGLKAKYDAAFAGGLSMLDALETTVRAARKAGATDDMLVENLLVMLYAWGAGRQEITP